MSSRNPTPAIAVACLITTWSFLKAQVAIPEGMPFIPGVNQPQIHHPVIPKDFRAIDFEVGPTSNRSSINASVAEGFNTNLDLAAFELPFFERGM